MNNTLTIIPIIFSLMLITMIIQFHHLLMVLFCLETLMLLMVMLTTLMSLSSNMNSPHMILSLLTMGACEASLGLSLMVMMARSYGMDNLSTSISNKC